MAKYPSLEGRQRKVHMSKAELPEAQVLTVLHETVTHGFMQVTEVRLWLTSDWKRVTPENTTGSKISHKNEYFNCIQLLWRACDE